MPMPIPRYPAPAKPFDLVGSMLDYEDGNLDDDGVIALFQHLIDTGLGGQLQGAYGRAAQSMIAAGHCSPKS